MAGSKPSRDHYRKDVGGGSEGSARSGSVPPPPAPVNAVAPSRFLPRGQDEVFAADLGIDFLGTIIAPITATAAPPSFTRPIHKRVLYTPPRLWQWTFAW